MAVLLIHHLRKRGPLAMFDRVTSKDFRGSGHITAIARSVLALSVVRAGEEYDSSGPRRPSELDQRQEWLVGTLREEGPMQPQEVIELAKSAGFSESTVYRARRKLKVEIQNTDGVKSPHNKWKLREALG